MNPTDERAFAVGQTVDVLVPESEGITETIVLEWMKSVGDAVQEHEPLLELSTDKVTVEVAAPAAGILTEVLHLADESVQPGTVLGRISIQSPAAPPVGVGDDAGAGAGDGDDDEIDWSDPHPEEFAGHRLSPLVRRLLREHNLSPDDIQGSGRDGRITHRDVLEHVTDEPMVVAGEGNPAPARQARDEEPRRIPHTPMRRAIASHMVDSMLRTAPHVTAVFDADLTAVLRHKAVSINRDPRLTLTAYFIRAAAIAAEAVPQINSRWHDDALEILPSVDIGVATALGDDGLIVPIVRRAHELELEEVAGRLEELTTRAKAGLLAHEDLIGGTLTLTNHGVGGSLIATPIINQPQSAIVGVGRMEKLVKVVTVDGQDSIQIRPMVYVSLTIDHRALDGYQANRYLAAFVEALEGWD